MSYNIDTWKTKQMIGLRIPIEALQYSEDMKKRGWKKECTINMDDNPITVSIPMADGGVVEGILLFDTKEVEVSKISLWGEGSGTEYHELLLPALKKSTGKLIAVLIWEGGDSISQLDVFNGNVEESDYEL